MDQQHRDLIVHKPERRIADDNGCTIDEVHAVLDRHPIDVDRDRYLKRALAMQLPGSTGRLPRQGRRGSRRRGALLVKVAERRATLLGLNPPIGHAVAVVQHEPANNPTSTERLRAAIDRIRGKTHQDDPPATDQDESPSTY